MEDIMILDCYNIIYEWIGYNMSIDNKEYFLSIVKVWYYLGRLVN